MITTCTPRVPGPKPARATTLCLALAVAALGAMSAGCEEPRQEERAGNPSLGQDAGSLLADASSPRMDAEASGVATDASEASAPSGSDAALSAPSAGDASAFDAGPTRDAGSAAADAEASDAARSDGGDPRAIASALEGLFLDVPCAASTPTPLANGATCAHPPGTMRIERAMTLGGDAGLVYSVTLRVRGVWEPTSIQGGQRPDKMHPFTIGGMPPSGTASSDPINYQQYSLQVSEPKQTYWLNDYQYVAHDIHKEDYQATIQVAGGARVTLVMNDGNDHQIANYTKAFFPNLPPYDKAPSTGQSLWLNVVSVQLVTR